MVNFKYPTKQQRKVFAAIMERAVSLYRDAGIVDDRMTIEMDICAANGDTGLDFDKLASFQDFDFAHDILGIRRHINRETGKLENCFVPRSAKRERIAA